MGAYCCREDKVENHKEDGGQPNETPLLGPGRQEKVKVRKKKSEKLGLGFEGGGGTSLVVKSVAGIAAEYELGRFVGSILTHVNGVEVRTLDDIQPFSRQKILHLSFLSQAGHVSTRFEKPLKREIPYTPPSMEPVRVLPKVAVPSLPIHEVVRLRIEDMFATKKYNTKRKNRKRYNIVLPQIHDTAVAATQSSRGIIEKSVTDWFDTGPDVTTELLLLLSYPSPEDSVGILNSLKDNLYKTFVGTTHSPMELLLSVLCGLDGPDLDYITGFEPPSSGGNTPLSLSDQRLCKTASALQSICVRCMLDDTESNTCYLAVPEATERLVSVWANMEGKYVVWQTPFIAVVGEAEVESGLVLIFKGAKRGVKIFETSLRPSEKEVLLPAFSTIKVDSITKILHKKSNKYVCKVVLAVHPTPPDLQKYYLPVTNSLVDKEDEAFPPTSPARTACSASSSTTSNIEKNVPKYLKVTAKAKPKTEGVYTLDWNADAEKMPKWNLNNFCISSISGRWTIGKKGLSSGQIVAEVKHGGNLLPCDIKKWARSKEGTTWVGDSGISVEATDEKVQQLPPKSVTKKKRAKPVIQPLQKAPQKLFTPTSSPFDAPSTTGPTFSRPMPFTPSANSEPATEPSKGEPKPEQDVYWNI
eukprot:TRINITY_DN12773_c0_g2_i3.p1 TRINITY_DN12773_c0_g2~~TRINITY_DN12773_c0_g2_i3.p1  ORF type:complete len:642 (+),score=72.81 TRINITY_DN12773_c0_g2_i3:431-2356(+)